VSQKEGYSAVSIFTERWLLDCFLSCGEGADVVVAKRQKKRQGMLWNREGADELIRMTS
jgi:hypothetical protein